MIRITSSVILLPKRHLPHRISSEQIFNKVQGKGSRRVNYKDLHETQR